MEDSIEMQGIAARVHSVLQITRMRSREVQLVQAHSRWRIGLKEWQEARRLMRLSRQHWWVQKLRKAVLLWQVVIAALQHRQKMMAHKMHTAGLLLRLRQLSEALQWWRSMGEEIGWRQDAMAQGMEKEAQAVRCAMRQVWGHWQVASQAWRRVTTCVWHYQTCQQQHAVIKWRRKLRRAAWAHRKLAAQTERVVLYCRLAGLVKVLQRWRRVHRAKLVGGAERRRDKS